MKKIHINITDTQSLSAVPKIPLVKGQKVAVKIKKNEWYCGTVKTVKRNGGYAVSFNDGDEIDLADAKTIKPITKVGKKAAYDEVEIAKLFEILTPAKAVKPAKTVTVSPLPKKPIKPVARAINPAEPVAPIKPERVRAVRPLKWSDAPTVMTSGGELFSVGPESVGAITMEAAQEWSTKLGGVIAPPEVLLAICRTAKIAKLLTPNVYGSSDKGYQLHINGTGQVKEDPAQYTFIKFVCVRKAKKFKSVDDVPSTPKMPVNPVTPISVKPTSKVLITPIK
jgi:hypothetical protein